MKTHFFLTLILIYTSLSSIAQNRLFFSDANRHSQQISFKLINNLIVIPLEVNGKELSFILDTGVNKTILFNISENDSISLIDAKKVTLRGLGQGGTVDALISKNNTLKLKGLIGKNETIFVILKDYFDLSSKMGTTIHGVIGYSLLNNFIVKVNYKTKKINFYNPKKFTYKICKRCETIPLTFYRKKPYINAKVSLDTINNKFTDVKLLLDSGGSDAIWLFENSKTTIKTPKRFFNDILGEGLSGPIFGNRSRVTSFKLGRFEIENPTASFLDSTSTHNARTFKDRNGSIGGGILKRFKVWIDYPNKKITLKKNGSFKKGFNYNMSGLDIIYAGKQLIKEESQKEFKDSYGQNTIDQNSISFITSYIFKFKPSYKIKYVVKNSPADKVGLQKDDILIKINGRYAYKYEINHIIHKFQEKDNQKIKLVIERNGVKMKFEFRLKKSV